MAGAVIGLAVVSSLTAVYIERQHTNILVAQTQTTDINPGTNRATLTLANGQTIDLDKAQNGSLANNAGINIQKTANGNIAYTTAGKSNAQFLQVYNTITTPNGGQYEIVLQDGTKVWLNAGTTITYPVTFVKETERKVKLTGEAYFEVSKAPGKPFIVESTTQRIVVLGTHFNVSCFKNEPVKTTLTEGKVEISLNNKSQKTTLKPGDQSIVSSNGIKVQQVNTEAVVAWKDGLFVFEDTDLQTVLKQISRWYDVEVDQSITDNKSFEGEIPRNISLAKALKAIEIGSHVKLKIEGRRIVQQ
jgi:transmembrane sensor